MKVEKDEFLIDGGKSAIMSSAYVFCGEASCL